MLCISNHHVMCRQKTNLDDIDDIYDDARRLTQVRDWCQGCSIPNDSKNYWTSIDCGFKPAGVGVLWPGASQWRHGGTVLNLRWIENTGRIARCVLNTSGPWKPRGMGNFWNPWSISVSKSPEIGRWPGSEFRITAWMNPFRGHSKSFSVRWNLRHGFGSVFTALISL